jgi:hypothetical protein
LSLKDSNTFDENKKALMQTFSFERYFQISEIVDQF